jgi:hypothetical protein
MGQVGLSARCRIGQKLDQFVHLSHAGLSMQLIVVRRSVHQYRTQHCQRWLDLARLRSAASVRRIAQMSSGIPPLTTRGTQPNLREKNSLLV